jgi:predicted ATPase
MITKMHIENFKCFKDFDIELGAFNVLIGPNDSGKTAFLQALRIIGLMPPGKMESLRKIGERLGIHLDDSVVWRNDPRLWISMRAFSGDHERLSTHLQIESKAENGAAPSFESKVAPFSFSPKNLEAEEARTWFQEAVGTVLYYRFDPGALRAPAAPTKRMFALEPTGLGFGNYLDDILRYDRETFVVLENSFYELFPQYEKIHLEKEQIPGSKAVGPIIRLSLRNGKKLHADGVSDGAILALAFLAITTAPEPPRVLLVEEPENGVHYSRLKQVIGLLNGIAKKDVQVIITTHSPYLLDLVAPEDVRVFSKDGEGAVHAARLSDFPDVEKMRKHFNSGEIWTAFDESEIVAKAGKKNG